MKILITNDDGVHASGIIEFAQLLQKEHQVFMVAPRTEQSGISQAITFLRPLFPIELGDLWESDSPIPGFSIDGTPTDCVKLALSELCPFKPDLILSGINAGLNAGSNVFHSGTVAGAMAGAQFGIPSIAVSLEYSTNMNFKAASALAVPLVERALNTNWPERIALNINIPQSALIAEHEVKVVPVETNPLGYSFDQGVDPKGRKYFWANNKPDPEPSSFATDCSELKDGHVTVSPITFNINADHDIQLFRDLNLTSTPAR
ncbi:MAG: 5'/3'-nucleotidase SurE [Planctomycetota bacterium]